MRKCQGCNYSFIDVNVGASNVLFTILLVKFAVLFVSVFIQRDLQLVFVGLSFLFHISLSTPVPILILSFKSINQTIITVKTEMFDTNKILFT